MKFRLAKPTIETTRNLYLEMADTRIIKGILCGALCGVLLDIGVGLVGPLL